jgi:succinyl-diaminopimelate desuccinylase
MTEVGRGDEAGRPADAGWPGDASSTEASRPFAGTPSRTDASSTPEDPGGHGRSSAGADAARDLLVDLVRIDSTSRTPGEAEALLAVAEVLRRECGETGVVSIGYTSDGAPDAVVVAPSARPETPAALLLFSAHIDVVPVEDPSAWTHDPFGAHIASGRLFGRGSSDMKSGLAAALVAVVELLREGRPVALAVSTGEEVGCRGAASVAELLRGHPIGAVIVPESTANEVVLGHRGALWLRVTTSGRAAHGSTPGLGVNAIEKAAAVIGRVSELPLLWHPQLGWESVNVGTIAGGSVPNIVPDRCVFDIDQRVIDDDAARLADWWMSQPEVSAVDTVLDLAPVWTSADDPWVRGLGAPVSERPASYFTDASVLVRSLPAGTPVVVWGPGDPAVVHTVDESVDLRAVEDARLHYLRVGRAWTGADVAGEA